MMGGADPDRVLIMDSAGRLITGPEPMVFERYEDVLLVLRDMVEEMDGSEGCYIYSRGYI